jgi:hypothetical protein
METEKVKELILKYEAGETSLDEENTIKVYFKSNEVATELEIHKAWFNELSQMQMERHSDGFEDRLFSKIVNEDDKSAKVVALPKKADAQKWILRIAASLLLVAMGIYVGRELKNDEVAEIKAEVNDIKALMLSQMKSNTASSRLQAVNYSFEINNADDEIIATLIDLIKTDDNQNVRLKAIEAISRFSDNRFAKEALVQLLRSETEPIAQMALIDAIVVGKDTSAIDALEAIGTDERSMKEVKDQAQFGILQLIEI